MGILKGETLNLLCEVDADGFYLGCLETGEHQHLFFPPLHLRLLHQSCSDFCCSVHPESFGTLLHQPGHPTKRIHIMLGIAIKEAKMLQEPESQLSYFREKGKKKYPGYCLRRKSTKKFCIIKIENRFMGFQTRKNQNCNDWPSAMTG